VKPIYFIISIFLSLILMNSAIAQDISISASIDTNMVQVGSGVTLTIRIHGIQLASAPKLPKIKGFRSQYLGPTTQVSIAGGQTKVSATHRYYLRAVQMGMYTIPAISIRHSRRVYETKPIKIQVIKGTRSAQEKGITAKDVKESISLEIIMSKKTAYVNEGIPVTIRLYVGSGVEVQEFNRQLDLPSAGFSVLPINNPTQRRMTIDSVRFVIVDFSTTVYPVRSGELTLGPAKIGCRALIRAIRGQRKARYITDVESEPHSITVKPLPTADQPSEFSGVVGQYELNVVAKPTSLEVGDPITLIMSVRGTGNIDAVNIPVITDLTQFKAHNPQINVKRSGNTGLKKFEQVIIPESVEIKAIPEIQFTYFDPEIGQYVTQSKGPIPIQVAPSSTEGPLHILEFSKGKAVKREVLGRDIIYIKDEIGKAARGDGRVYKNKGFLFLQLLPLVGFAGMMVYQKRRDRFATDRTYARQYQAPRKAKKGLVQAQEQIASDQPQEFCSTIFKTMQEYLGDRFNLPSAGITIEVVDSLRSQSFAEETLEKLTAFFHACDRLRFTQCEMNEQEMTEILDMASEIIKLLENGKAAA